MIPLYISPLSGEIVPRQGSRATVSAMRRMPSLPLSGTHLYGTNYTLQLCPALWPGILGLSELEVPEVYGTRHEVCMQASVLL